jgi:hypothetical protein
LWLAGLGFVQWWQQLELIFFCTCLPPLRHLAGAASSCSEQVFGHSTSRSSCSKPQRPDSGSAIMTAQTKEGQAVRVCIRSLAVCGAANHTTPHPRSVCPVYTVCCPHSPIPPTHSI